MRPGAIFDLDGTLVRGTSTERLLVPWLIRRRVIGVRQIAAGAALAALYPLVGRTRALRRNKRWLVGIEVAVVEAQLGLFIDEVVAPRWCRPVLEMMEELRSEGHLVALLSGAPDFIVRAVARRLGAEAWVGTPLEIEGGRFTGRLAGAHVFGPQKAITLRLLAEEQGLDLGRSWGFADHPTDVDFLDQVGNRVAVDPGPRLRRAAEAGGWRVIASG